MKNVAATSGKKRILRPPFFMLKRMEVTLTNSHRLAWRRTQSSPGGSPWAAANNGELRIGDLDYCGGGGGGGGIPGAPCGGLGPSCSGGGMNASGCWCPRWQVPHVTLWLA